MIAAIDVLKSDLPSRRLFLTLGCGTAFASALPPRIFAQSARADIFSNRNIGAYAQGLITQTTFERLIGSVFTADLGSGNYARLTLFAVQPGTPQAASASQQPATKVRAAILSSSALTAKSSSSSFIITFTTDAQLVPQETYTVDHGTLGSFAVFLVPGDPVRGGTCSATFNFL